MTLKTIFKSLSTHITLLIGDDKEYWYGWAGILCFLAIDYLDQKVIIPRTKWSSLNSQVDCHDNPAKCWIIKKSK